jgi:hypothetical protein
VTRDSGRNRELQALIEDVKSTEPKPIDWDRLEAGLMREIRRHGPDTKPSRWQPSAWLLVPLAAAAFALGIGLWSFGSRHVERVATPSLVMPTNDELNGDAVPPTEVVSAETSPLRINHLGRASWTLAPGSSARVLASNEVVRIRLLSGRLRAEVVPTNEPERFVVEAADTRVAVHGTVFTVELRTDRTVVQVEQGVVAVGPLTHSSKRSALLYANDRRDFSLNGVPLSSDTAAATARRAARRHAGLRAPVPTAMPSNSSEQPVAPLPEAAASETPAPQPVPSVLTIGEVEAGVGALVDGVSRCFQENTTDSGSVRVMARTSVTLEIAPDGTVTAALFSPPLSPAVQDCSSEEAYALHFPPSLEGASVTRVLELSR